MKQRKRKAVIQEWAGQSRFIKHYLHRDRRVKLMWAGWRYLKGLT